MKYIDLSLKKHNPEDYKHYTIDQVIEDNNIVVLLGPPGSGKTSILEKYAEENPDNSQFLKIKNFLKLDNQVKEETSVLLLDGLDEYRSITLDKTFVLSELGNKINQLEDIKIIISCREMDWYGEMDSKALKDQIKETAALYSVLPLDDDQKVELANLLEIEDTQAFIGKFSKYGFLDNPQMLVMLANIYKNNPQNIIGSKKDLYLTFIKNAREQNRDHTINGTGELEAGEMLKYVGYIAFYYLFSGIDELDDDFIDEVCSSDQGYIKEDLSTVLKTKLFQDKRFRHRTIAEFSLAYFLMEYKLNTDSPISVERIKNLFIKKGRVPTELRGTYAWFCSLTGNEEFIKVDPYYQAVHGDNSLFDNELKKRIVLEVKEYAKEENPYFFEFRETMDLDGFYNDDLDGFLMSEFNDALKTKNHYIYFIINIMILTEERSSIMIGFLKEKIFDNSIPSYLRDDMVRAFHKDIVFLKSILDSIKDGVIADEKDNIKESLLRILYPEHIRFDEVADYLILYESRVGGYCYYLYDTDYDNKFSLIDSIYKLSYDKERDPKLLLPDNIKGFIEDYLLETLLKYNNGLTEKEIYKIIKHFKQYHKQYEKLKVKSFRYSITDEEKASNEKLTELANELFSLYVDDLLKIKDTKFSTHSFRYFFSYKDPDRISEILFEKMDSNLDPETNENLFWTALSYSLRDKDNKLIVTGAIKEIVEKLGLEKEFTEWLNPKKAEWEIESEKYEKEEKEKEEKTKEDNENYFASKRDEEIQSNFKDLHYIANLMYVVNDDKDEEKYLEKETVERLKLILKEAIFNDPIDAKLQTIESLATNSPTANRYIDIMHYVSCALNDSLNIKSIDIEFLKYLYIVVLARERPSNVIKTGLAEQVEKEDNEFAKSTLKEYLVDILSVHFLYKKELLSSYICASDDIEDLKTMIESYGSNLENIQDSILNNFLTIFNFKIKQAELEELSKIELNEDNENIIVALKTFAEDQKEDFTINMAISLYSLFEHKIERFTQLNSAMKIKIIDYMISQFNMELSLQFVSGFQSPKSRCADFLRNQALQYLGKEELSELKEYHYDEDDIWTYRITHMLNEQGQQEADQNHKEYPVDKSRDFILSNDIVSNEDFFADVYRKIENLKTEIEDNRNNDKDPFYNQDKSKKTEEACRDVIMHRLKDKYGYDLDITKEKHEANNRVDLNIKYRADPSYEIQIECKRDGNDEINTGIPDQLIGKYFSSGVQYGIYLVFYFRDKKNKELLLSKIDDSIPKGYMDNIKVICMDLTYD